MKKNFLLFFATMLCVNLSAQAYRGFHSDNYSGYNGALSNPALINNNKLGADINLISADVLLSNDYLQVDFTDLENFDAGELDAQSSNLIMDAQILGPSFFFRLNEKSALGVFTKARLMANAVDVNGQLIDVFASGFDDATSFNLTNQNVGILQNTWAEVGLTYARDIWSNQKNSIKGGVSLKYLLGASSTFAQSDNFTFNYNAGLETINMGGKLAYSYSNDFLGDGDVLTNLSDNIGQSIGFGGDVGLTYELKDSKSAEGDYVFRLGAAVLDIGRIRYDLKQAEYDLNDFDLTENPGGIVSLDEFESIGSDVTLQEFLSENYGFTEKESKEEVNLPTTLNLSGDLKLTKTIYLNATSNIALTDGKGKRETRALTHHTLTPRFETQFLSLWSPVGIDEFQNFTWGAGLRFGLIYVGSGSVLSSLLDDTKIADAYFGVKIPIARKVREPKEEEPKEEEVVAVEEVEKDSDMDGVVDGEDECVNVKGTKNNKGCPETKIEKIEGKADTIVVSKTTETVEVVETDGDSDLDGILDSVDDCPDVFGTIENNGCPVTLKEVETFRQDVREVFFETASSNVNMNSSLKLTNALAVMKKFPDLYWIVEGHTDNVGDEKYNQKLSESRAESVKAFFIQNGIPANKLSAFGYGELRPQTTNATVAGRAKNRRVEIRAANAEGKLVGLDLPKEDVENELSNLVKFIYFETGSDVIIDNSKAQLDLIAYYINKYGGTYEIQGHTDNVGSEELNMILSDKRAKAVVKYLVNVGGVPSQNLNAVGYGELKPIADNNTKDGQAENRRIEIKKKSE